MQGDSNLWLDNEREEGLRVLSEVTGLEPFFRGISEIVSRDDK